MKTVVDTNVLLDIITQDATWCSWSERALRKAAEHSTPTRDAARYPTYFPALTIIAP